MYIHNFDKKISLLARKLADRVVNDHYFGDDFLIYGAENENITPLTYCQEAQELYNKYYKEFKTTINLFLKN